MCWPNVSQGKKRPFVLFFFLQYIIRPVHRIYTDKEHLECWKVYTCITHAHTKKRREKKTCINNNKPPSNQFPLALGDGLAVVEFYEPEQVKGHSFSFLSFRVDCVYITKQNCFEYQSIYLYIIWLCVIYRQIYLSL